MAQFEKQWFTHHFPAIIPETHEAKNSEMNRVVTATLPPAPCIVEATGRKVLQKPRTGRALQGLSAQDPILVPWDEAPSLMRRNN